MTLNYIISQKIPRVHRNLITAGIKLSKTAIIITYETLLTHRIFNISAGLG
jgi:hypothetical protein